MQMIIGFVLIYMLVGVFKSLISNIVGITFPIIKSLEALETNDPKILKVWLAYWVIFSMFSIFVRFAKKYFIAKIIPFYFFIKISLLIWLQHPSTRGAQYLVDHVVQPYIDGNEANFVQFKDDVLRNTIELVTDHFG